MYLKGFMGEYEIFCVDKELAVIGDKIDVQGRSSRVTTCVSTSCLPGAFTI